AGCAACEVRSTSSTVEDNAVARFAASGKPCHLAASSSQSSAAVDHSTTHRRRAGAGPFRAPRDLACMSSEAFRIGFLTAIESPEKGFVGGLLITNHFGRPLE